MILVYGYFEGYVAELLSEQGCILVFDGIVKFFRYFLSFVQCTCYTYSLNHWLYSFKI